jgi:hypothetical protein
MAMITSLADRTPVRGAVCIGTGTELAANNFYGPALAEAHYLESECADYPRIVVSARTAQFVKKETNFSTNPMVNRGMVNLATVCQSLLHYGGKGEALVDYLGEGMQYFSSPLDPKLIDAVRKAYSFVISESDRFRKEGNEKLANRYVSLRNYFESRLSLWGLQKAKHNE